jgi:CheY-like chemotaxis protein
MAAAAVTVPTRTLLVVDDEQVVRMVLRRYFERLGWTVIDCESAERALALLAERAAPDLVICDLNLPGLSGAALCGRLTELRPELASRLILTSGDPAAAEAVLRDASLECPTLGKPFTLADIDRLLGAIGCAA